MSVPDVPDGPLDLGARGWFAALKRTVREFLTDNVTDWAAALTYYGVLSIFPGLLVLLSVLGMLGERATREVTGTLQQVAPQQVGQFLTGVVDQVRAGSSTGANIGAVVGLLVAFWSASGYIAAFMRASNAIYDVPEGRPIWKTLAVRLAVTAVIGLMLIASAVIVVFTGDLAEAAGEVIGASGAALTVWSIAKWPVLVLLVSLMFALLYWASPNAKQPGFRWISPGGILAVLIWIAASVAFAVYLANFANYNKTYGTVAGVIIFLVWLWITNIAILLGAEMDAELQRQRAIVGGHPADAEPFLPLRDDRKLATNSTAESGD
ncbi:YihY/virulence factor BrkB family protein [Micromonospora sp. WMMD718]|uniref:YihY/virulence factor BrkB family protein n=1 Tax=Micromonospora TaxID=1873 RepID=UPI000A75BEE6|nr:MULTISPECIES: YihY/virulence factor BrkB family protein [unclassified Micromonospora]MDG4751594.1 YihY/virulence factor BrkB family protein [Micromonospora sp. WMMD718]